MRLNPSILVRRFAVEKGGKYVYDEHFHSGVNIIRGENSSGKSTVLNLLFFSLGGDVNKWSEHALSCNRTLVEVELSGKLATLRREITSSRGQAMDVFPGSLEEATAGSAERWTRYPYAKNTDRDSLTQAVFRLLEIPESLSDQAGNITMHQVLRALYADQLTPPDQLLRFEPFDSPALRDAVGRLLSGAYDNDQYGNLLLIRRLEADLDAIIGEQRSLFQVLGRTEEENTANWLQAERSNFTAQLESKRQTIAELEHQQAIDQESRSLSLSAQDNAYTLLQTTQQQLADKRNQYDSLAFEISDAKSFISDLEHRLAALNQAETVTAWVEDVRFDFCPACYSAVDEPLPHACHLCKTPYDSERSKKRVVALIADVSTQLRQSRRVQQDRLKEREKLAVELEGLSDRWRQAARTLSDVSRSPSSEISARLGQLQREVGYLERQIDDLSRREAISRLISELTEKKAMLSAQIAQLKSRNESIRTSQSTRMAKAYSEISDQIRGLLRGDLPREEKFMRAESIQFSFEGNRITVDGGAYFSASSLVVLRNSFFAGFLLAAARDAAFRHPRFCIMDSIEDKGMEQARSHNYQEVLVEAVSKLTTDCQLIFGTSMISPLLEASPLTVGRFSTQAHKTLQFS